MEEMEQDHAQTGNDSTSASASMSSSTLISSQGSAPMKSKSRSTSKDRSSRKSRDFSRRREHHSKSKRRRRSKSRSGYPDRRGRHKRRRSRSRSRSRSLVLRSPKGRTTTRRSRERRRSGDRLRTFGGMDRYWGRLSRKSRSSSRRKRRERGRSSSRSSSRERKAISRRNVSRSRSPPPRWKSKQNAAGESTSMSSLSSAEIEAIRKHSEDLKLDSSDDNNSSPSGSELTSEDRKTRFNTRVIFITNLSPEVTKNQLEILFGCVGTIMDIDLYPVDNLPSTWDSKSARTSSFIKFGGSASANVAVHLLGHPFLGRPLLVFPCFELDDIPDPAEAAKLLSVGVEKLIDLIKGENINEFLKESNEQSNAKSSSSAESASPAAAATEKDSSSSEISILLSWSNDWLSWFWKDIK